MPSCLFAGKTKQNKAKPYWPLFLGSTVGQQFLAGSWGLVEFFHVVLLYSSRIFSHSFPPDDNTQNQVECAEPSEPLAALECRQPAAVPALTVVTGAMSTACSWFSAGFLFDRLFYPRCARNHRPRLRWWLLQKFVNSCSPHFLFAQDPRERARDKKGNPLHTAPRIPALQLAHPQAPWKLQVMGTLGILRRGQLQRLLLVGCLCKGFVPQLGVGRPT